MKFFPALRFFLYATLALPAAGAWADPPARVGRIAYLSGEVAFAGESVADQPAQLNYPLTSGNRLTTGERSQVEIQIGSSALRLDRNSELRISRLDDEVIRLDLGRGSLNARMGDSTEANVIEVKAGGVPVVLQRAGRYRLDVEGGVTSLAVHDGEARIMAGMAYTVSSGQTGQVRGGSFVQGGTLGTDEFDAWALSRDRLADESASSRYVSRDTTGYQDLDAHGRWITTSEYGPVWQPDSVLPDWSPYSTGSWAWVPPWGWSWVDSAPWGFAPFHFGRWASIGGRWSWVPGRIVPRPAYAPALVAFVDQRGARVRPSAGKPPARWIPLAPDEYYVPAFPASDVFVRRLNGGVLPPPGIDASIRRPHFANRPIMPRAQAQEEGVAGRPGMSAPTADKPRVKRQAPGRARSPKGAS